MIAVIQRVSQASVSIAGGTVGQIGRGLLVLAAVEKGDSPAQAQRLAQRLLSYRVFPDEDDKMNLSVTDIGGELLLVSQFTLAADTRKGTRPSFTPAAEPETGRRLFNVLVGEIRQQYPHIQTGRFGANMQVSLVNEGPVTFILKAPPQPK